MENIKDEQAKKEYYRTGELAALIGIHPNTVRFYEQAGLLTPPVRRPNGYRVYTELHLYELRLIRAAMRSEVLQNGLRKQSLIALKLCAALLVDEAISATEDYRRMLSSEIDRAQYAISSVEHMLRAPQSGAKTVLKRREAAEKLGVTIDTLRNWELNGLITIKRSQNGYRVYFPDDMERLAVIRTLHSAGYSLSAVLRLLTQLDSGCAANVSALLDTPGGGEDILSACDHLITALNGALLDARQMQELLLHIKELTLQ